MSEIKVQEMSCLSDKAILRHIKHGNISIYPLNIKNINTSSVDVTLGKYYFREQQVIDGNSIFNPYSKAMIQKVWGEPESAQCAGDWMKETGIKLDNISDTDHIIWIRPNETILGHTNEFIGGRNFITTSMQCRSSVGRSFIEVCKCAD